MRVSRFLKRQWLVLTVLLLSYGAGYAYVRSQRILVHRTSYATEGASRRYFHNVVAGDFGPGLLQGRATPLVVSGCYWTFTPLRWLEALVWTMTPKDVR